jgi:hypothetical protein
MLMKEAGILDIELQHAMPKPTICESDAFSKVNILDVAPAMILLAIGMALSLLVLVLEYFWYWRKKNSSTSTKPQLCLQSKNNIIAIHKLPETFADGNKIFYPTLRKIKVNVLKRSNL